MHRNVLVWVCMYTQISICFARSCLQRTLAEFDLLASSKALNRRKIVKTATEINSFVSTLAPLTLFSLASNRIN